MFTTAQKAIVKADILTRFPGAQAGSDGSFAIADAYNVAASPDFFVYRTAINPQEVFDQILWAKLTPQDTPDGTAAWTNRSLACQGKQFNIQIILQGQAAIDGSKANVRAGLQDALTGVPSGASGATQSAGWVGVRDVVLAKKATIIEKLLATGNGGTAATAAVMGFEGPVSWQDIDSARTS